MAKKKKKKISSKQKRLFIILGIEGAVLAGLIVFLLFNFVFDKDTVSEASSSKKTAKTESTNLIAEAEEIPAPPTPSPTPAFEEYDITLMAVGDNLMHMGMVNSGRQDDGSYNFDLLYEDIAPFLEKADISIINQETIFGGNELGFSGYPYFNSPTEVGDALVKAGFNVVLQSSNHTLDQGVNGMLNAIEFWKQYPEVLMVGIHDKYEGEREIPTMEVKGVTFAVLNYTYGPNFGSYPKNTEGMYDILCAYDESSRVIDYTELNPDVISDIKRAKEIADIVIVCPHWGEEYRLEPTSYQEKFAKEMTDAGADLIIGAHPHVCEKVEYVRADNGNESLCYYSLGNYISTQQNRDSMLENMAWVTFHVTEDDVYIDREKTGSIPIICQYLSGPLRFEGIYPLEDYTEELAQSHGVRNWGGVSFHLSDMQELSEEVLGSSVIPKSVALGE